jgi:transcriptional regulator with XRE-family HTH domain
MKLKEIGGLIKKRREFLNLRQEDLSELSKVTIKTIHLVERGSGNPSFETLNKLSEVLGLELLLQVKKLS